MKLKIWSALRIRNRCHVKNRRLLFKSFPPHQPLQLQPQIRPRLPSARPYFTPLYSAQTCSGKLRAAECLRTPIGISSRGSAAPVAIIRATARRHPAASLPAAHRPASLPRPASRARSPQNAPTAGTFPSAIRWAASRESALSRPHPPQLPPESLRRVHLEPHQQILCMSHLNSSTSSASGADFPSRANPLILSFRTESAE
jgi:hypothetical protein